MKIESYDLQMQTSSSFIQKNKTYETAQAITVNFTQDEVINQFKLSLSSKIVFNAEDSLSEEDRLKKTLIEYLLGIVSKKKPRLHPKQDTIKESNVNTNPYVTTTSQGNSVNLWGLVYESTEEYFQKSTIDFSTSAKIKTSSGDFDIALDLSFTQEFLEVHKESINILSKNFEDPLIIKFKGDPSFDNISKKQSFIFDINSDGKKEDIPMLKSGVGFLALDKNKNGQIDDGSELFGTKSGDGFAHLREYDEDGNNWIDENDSIFKDLRVWEKSENGENNLLSLYEAGVGAIYLAGIDSNFSYSKSIGQDIARLKDSSIFLKETGEAGIITNVDFVV